MVAVGVGRSVTVNSAVKFNMSDAARKTRVAVRGASFFFGVRCCRIMLGTILGRFSIIYYRGLGLRIRVRVLVRVWVSVMVRVRVSMVLWSG